MRKGALHRQGDFFHVEGFHHEIVCAEPNRFDGIVTRPERRDDNHRDRSQPRLIPHVVKTMFAPQLRHAPVAEAEVGNLFREQIDGLRAVRRFQDFISSCTEYLGERFPEIDLIIDDQDRIAHSGNQDTWTLSGMSSTIGRMIRTRVPSPSALSTWISPRCARTNSWQMERPSPVPDGFVVKKGSKTLLIKLELIPFPVSRNSTRTRSVPDTDFTSDVTLTHKVPPDSVIASIAF